MADEEIIETTEQPEVADGTVADPPEAVTAEVDGNQPEEPDQNHYLTQALLSQGAALNELREELRALRSARAEPPPEDNRDPSEKALELIQQLGQKIEMGERKAAIERAMSDGLATALTTVEALAKDHPLTRDNPDLTGEIASAAEKAAREYVMANPGRNRVTPDMMKGWFADQAKKWQRLIGGSTKARKAEAVVSQNAINKKAPVMAGGTSPAPKSAKVMSVDEDDYWESKRKLAGTIAKRLAEGE